MTQARNELDNARVEIGKMTQTMTPAEATTKASKPSKTALAIRVARELEKTRAHNPVVSSQAIGPKTARVKEILKKYGVDV